MVTYVQGCKLWLDIVENYEQMRLMWP